MKLAVFYHVFVNDPHPWEAVYLEQIGALYISKLYDQLSHLHIGVAGNPALVRTPDSAVLTVNPNAQEETDTLRALHSYAKQNPDAYILYMHTKNVSRMGHPSHRPAEDWRRCMEYFCIHNWESATKELADHDAVGINWQTETSMGYWPHFSGNMWWATGKYLAKLTDEYLEHSSRFMREFWIGSGFPNVKNLWETGLNIPGDAKHYHTLYPKKEYTKNYLNSAPTSSMSTVLTHTSASEEILNLLSKLEINGFESSGGTDKGTIHDYTGIYEKLLAPYRDKEINLLEIGVQHGGSSLLWHEYLPQAQLYLVDIQDIVPDKIWDAMDGDRYDFYHGTAYSEAAVDMFAADCPDGFDIIIDDGPHTLDSQLFTAREYYGLLKEGGVMIIEDVQDYSHINTLTATLSLEDKDKVEVYDNRHTGRYDDLIWVFKK